VGWSVHLQRVDSGGQKCCVKAHTAKIKSICGIATSINSQLFKRNLAGVIKPEMAVYKELEDCIFNRG
jgi:hypothetical protein